MIPTYGAECVVCGQPSSALIPGDAVVHEDGNRCLLGNALPALAAIASTKPHPKPRNGAARRVVRQGRPVHRPVFTAPPLAS